MAKIIILDTDRRARRATRKQLGLSQATLERAAKVGKTNVKRL